ncbi:hypothetical protein JMUB590_2227 [Staphylococcus caprae]|uniref:Uncharacterized protein n=1 Tax=Staphylococcus caprae TaxID=29380 RepID=A0ABM7FRB1_9STAP|nr:hypothetical protein JMUB145_2226 [Staphylococcus caprae]BBD93281.1 hypothetical protein JMUB590_2227 [Staphylococcus caprae]BBD95783.1 hypothetical protein JMUB898_2218 [Staphylococcus caprae]
MPLLEHHTSYISCIEQKAYKFVIAVIKIKSILMAAFVYISNKMKSFFRKGKSICEHFIEDTHNISDDI